MPWGHRVVLSLTLDLPYPTNTIPPSLAPASRPGAGTNRGGKPRKVDFLEEEMGGRGGAVKMAQWVEELATKLDSLSLTPRTHSEKENQL